MAKERLKKSRNFAIAKPIKALLSGASGLAVTIVVLALTVAPAAVLTMQLLKDNGQLIAANPLPAENLLHGDLQEVNFSSNDYSSAKDGKLGVFKNGLVTITLDDGWRSSYVKAFPLLEQYGFNATHYILSSTFNDPSYLTEGQVKQMIEAGQEIASHTKTHPDLTTLDDQTLVDEVLGSKQALNKMFNLDIKHFASPLGEFNIRTLGIISQYYETHRNVSSDITSLSPYSVNIPLDVSNIVGMTITDSTKLSDLKKALEFTKKHKGWLVLNYHSFDEVDSEYDLRTDTFIEHLDVIKNSGLKVPTIGQFIDEYRTSNGS